MNNPGPRISCVLVVSCPQSAETARALTAAGSDFRRFLESDELAHRRVEIAVIEFGQETRVSVPLQVASGLADIEFSVSDDAPTVWAAALHEALGAVEARKQLYKDEEVEYYRPWTIVLSDDVPASGSVFEAAVNRLNEVIARDSATVFLVGIGERADLMTLSRLSMPQRPAVNVSAVNFSAFFERTGQFGCRILKGGQRCETL